MSLAWAKSTSLGQRGELDTQDQRATSLQPVKGVTMKKRTRRLRRLTRSFRH